MINKKYVYINIDWLKLSPIVVHLRVWCIRAPIHCENPVFYVFQGIVDHKDDNFYKKRNFLPNYDTRRKGYSLIDEIIIKVNSEYIGYDWKYSQPT